MIRFLLRSLGLLVLAAAFIFIVYDGMKWIADRMLVVTRVDAFWNTIHAASQQEFQSWIIGLGWPWLWDPVALAVLRAPVWAALGVVGVVLLLLGRKPRPLIGYARS